MATTTISKRIPCASQPYGTAGICEIPRSAAANRQPRINIFLRLGKEARYSTTVTAPESSVMSANWSPVSVSFCHHSALSTLW